MQREWKAEPRTATECTLSLDSASQSGCARLAPGPHLSWLVSTLHCGIAPLAVRAAVAAHMLTGAVKPSRHVVDFIVLCRREAKPKSKPFSIVHVRESRS